MLLEGIILTYQHIKFKLNSKQNFESLTDLFAFLGERML